MIRKANCSCGDLSIELRGDPVMVAVCNCTHCQKRTGSAFGIGAYFSLDQIVLAINHGKVFVDSSDAGRSIERTFCDHCGSTVYWKAEFQPGFIGVAVGCFADADFPEPTAAVWAVSKLHWVDFPEHWICLPKQDKS